jgi:hypothetical protein
LESFTPLHRNQFAYQPGKSTETALHQLVTRIEKTLDAKGIALGAFLDIEEAFYNTSYLLLSVQLNERASKTPYEGGMMQN